MFKILNLLKIWKLPGIWKSYQFNRGNRYVLYSCKLLRAENGPLWKVEMSVRRPWPKCWYDHRPWNTYSENLPPVRTYYGSKNFWYELRGEERTCYGTGGLDAVLKSFALEEATERLSLQAQGI